MQCIRKCKFVFWFIACNHVIDKSQQDELKKKLKLMPNMEYEHLPLDVLLVVSMFLTLGENAQKVPMRRRIA
jgi:hypothetical protein